jgi:hypothetical protein
METPGSVPSGEGEAVPLVTGQVVPPGSVLPAPDAVETGDAAQAPRKRVWPFLFKPRWLAWHLLVALAAWGMAWLGDWQFHRAVGGNGLSWAYTFEWPLFAGFAVVFWARTIKDEFQMRRGGISETELMRRAAVARSMATLPAGAILPAGSLPEGVSVQQLGQPVFNDAYNDADDPELARYNARLARLNAKDRRKALEA